ncbi:O-methyltransferas-like protein [Sporormia fimetaria CBS 119925]|uniref:O-methyltransferas-like protein n=1 Tax=Sporormia fimetaria CBS 119925 TaxID=1340428 RepID=A0A6A6VD01_9PLEO|nr:O-methyltransferas-like protein [Sporormia fimetaria CBS 119925]
MRNQTTGVRGDKTYNALRNSLNDTANDLLLLVNGPKIQARKDVCKIHDLAAFQVAFHLDFFNTIPEAGSMHLRDIAQKTGCDINRAGRILRLLTTHRIFREVERDIFAHTSYSVALARDPELKAAGDYQLDEVSKAASECSLSFQTGAKTPFEQRHGMTVYDYYAANPAMAARFAKGLVGITRLDRQMTELITGYPWAEIGDAKVVDIGAGNGHVSVELARRFPNLNMVVQDNNLDILNQGATRDLTGVEGRMAFMEYDFFTPQPVTDADVYFCRQVLHNWDDASCVKLLRSAATALEKCRPGTPLLINETVQPEPGTRTRFEENLIRQNDMLLLVAFGAKQRTEEDYRALLEQADPRFKIVKVCSEGSMGLLEVHLQTNTA